MRDSLGRRNRPMRVSSHLVSIVLAAALACGGDRSITQGIANEHDWSQRLANAVPLGTAADSVRTIMESNGFQCRAGVDSVAYFACSKSTKDLVSKKWWAILSFDRRARLIEARAHYGLIGP